MSTVCSMIRLGHETNTPNGIKSIIPNDEHVDDLGQLRESISYCECVIIDICMYIVSGSSDIQTWISWTLNRDFGVPVTLKGLKRGTSSAV